MRCVSKIPEPGGNYVIVAPPMTAPVRVADPGHRGGAGEGDQARMSSSSTLLVSRTIFTVKTRDTSAKNA